jgi:hypothetical protein
MIAGILVGSDWPHRQGGSEVSHFTKVAEGSARLLTASRISIEESGRLVLWTRIEGPGSLQQGSTGYGQGCR